MSTDQRRHAMLKHRHSVEDITGLSGTGGTGGALVDVQVFQEDGTWTKPAGASDTSIVRIHVTSAGGGGAGGARSATLTAKRGGGGGAGGCISEIDMLAGDITDTVAVVIGLGGAGGIAAIADSTTGATLDGYDGGESSFGDYLSAAGGPKGSGGSNGSGGGGGTYSQPAYDYLTFRGMSGGDSSHTGVAASGETWVFSTTIILFNLFRGCGGGGGGGGITAADVALAGGSGSDIDSVTFVPSTFRGLGGLVPTVGGNFGGTLGFGGGGGGGTRQASGVGTNGVDGGYPGGGGGGGSASINGFQSGAGGHGSDGVVVVTTWL